MATLAPTETNPLAAARKALLAWYRPRRVAYPWRAGPADPYRVLVSEVMAQQTQAHRVGIAFERFIDRFPTIGALATSSRADVLRAWAGLGYNRRALAVHQASRVIEGEHAGRVPDDLGALRALPGVGPYTAAAVASIAFGRPVAAIDTNVRRVISRAALGVEAEESAPGDIRRGAEAWLDPRHPGAWNQAVMDLGRVVCRPHAPRCDECPLRPWCAFVAADRTARRPGGRAPAFEGSSRQARGEVVRILRGCATASSRTISESTGIELGRILSAVEGLVREGLVERTRNGRLRLPAG
jgi:A/G-specific adenine glycosylase